MRSLRPSEPMASSGGSVPLTGADDDPRVGYGLAKLEGGREELRRAFELTGSFTLPGIAEQKARSALSILRSALDWLEDTDHFERAHVALDTAGRQVRERFGCHLAYDPRKGYSQTCPVALAHSRLGLSPAFIIYETECSICDHDPEDCSHITGRRYGDQVCHRVIKKGEMLEVSLVGRPNDPDARIGSISIPRSDLERDLDSRFRYGMPVSCDRCLTRCSGMTELPGAHA